MRTQDGSLVYEKDEEKSQCLAATCNSTFCAVYMRNFVIKIYDTQTGALIVPYNLNTNLLFLSSNSDGLLSFVDLSGKLTLLSVSEKKLILEDSDSIPTLIKSLRKEDKSVGVSMIHIKSGQQLFLTVSSKQGTSLTFLYD